MILIVSVISGSDGVAPRQGHMLPPSASDIQLGQQRNILKCEAFFYYFFFTNI